MTDPTISATECKEKGPTLEDRVEYLEHMTRELLGRHKDMLGHFREMVVAVTEISGESSDE